MSYAPWKILSVAEFLDQYRECSEIQSASEQTSDQQLDLIWQKQTVQAFFASYQWSPVAPEQSQTEPFGFRLSVQSYFQYFAWDAPVKDFAPQPEETLNIQNTPEVSLNLQNFSDLF